MKSTQNEISEFENYITNGCMRCKFGGTPQCKVLKWTTELNTLRQIVLETNLKEEIKWGVPVYTLNGKNIVSVNALKDTANISFFKGVLLKDKNKILQQQGNLQSGRILKFTNTIEIIKLKEVLKQYVIEAISIEESGKKVEFKTNLEPFPEELLQIFESNTSFKEAFFNLTKGRQRGYIIYFSQPKQLKTRLERIEKCKDSIYKGIGLHDKFKP